MREWRVRTVTLGMLPTQHGMGGRSIPERSQILLRKSGCWRLAMMLVTAVLCSAATPTAQTQPIRTFPASVVFQGDSFDCGPAALATLIQLRLQRGATLLELTQTVPELSRQEWRRVQTEGYSLGQLVTMAAAVGVRPTLR